MKQKGETRSRYYFSLICFDRGDLKRHQLRWDDGVQQKRHNAQPQHDGSTAVMVEGDGGLHVDNAYRILVD